MKGELKVKGLEEFGYMWECPDYFQLNGKDILVFSPQGIERQECNYQNIFNVIFVVGRMELEKLEFEVDYYQEMDKGFDFYAPQTFEDHQNRRLMFAWAGIGESAYPTDDNMWAHCLTLPRELKLIDGKLIQSPVYELGFLRENKQEIKETVTGKQIVPGFNGDIYELSINIKAQDAKTFGVELLHFKEEGLSLRFDKEKSIISLDRSKFAHQVKSDYGSIRTAKWEPQEEVNVRVFVDKSIVEIFINGGEIVFSTRVFPRHKSTSIQIFSDFAADYNLVKYDLGRGICN